MTRFKKVYLEITNVCDLRCAFCPGTERAPRFMTESEFDALLARLRGWTDYLYFHLMGEPLLHPALGLFLRRAGEAGFRVCLTTNGTHLPAQCAQLAAAPALHRVNISLQSWEANPERTPLADYVRGCASSAGALAAAGKLVSLRLWNGGGAEARNGEILDALHEAFPGAWRPAQRNTVLAERVFLERGEKFDWPRPDAAETGAAFCRGLRDQLGILCDGTVVPCCLDAAGALALGNLLETPLEAILAAPRARALYDGFSRRQPSEDLCRRCGYAARF